MTTLTNNNDGRTKVRAMCTVVAQAVSAAENLGVTVAGIRVLDLQGAPLATRSGSGSCQ